MTINKERIKNQRIGTIVDNISGFKMECIEYRNSMDVDVRFLESGKIVQNVQWNNFVRGKVKDGYVDSSYKKEYGTWCGILTRCLDSQYKEQKPTYRDVLCCDEWLLFENFYEWLHSQPNFDKWKDLKWSAIDKDILIKGNKVYSPETCCLVPVNVNNLFVKHDALRGECPIGVFVEGDKYVAQCTNSIIGKSIRIGLYDSAIEAFEAYKKYKENLIKEIADIEYKNGTITKKCRDAMYSYIVEIDD
jgi:hypothetical protein